ncbi:hypothetical protein G4Y73_06410 [Wenzhouxiangella sp. XN201]|uniref:hypothetical protein n=1 Tax=Wenzhouxiangella sp. XN201 TaxID=2710755 RepID=UPI0013C5AE31|nr:hypothetical protein [Wenzhouxiangella sp. XN201]NEZ03780.1 hypothetical protein [Wenzhouxiangella sp. XN201]
MSDNRHDEKLWKRVEEWRERLADCENYPVLSALKESWAVLQEDQPEFMKKIHRGRMSHNPIVALMFCIETGEYPAPELLLTMLDCYREYMNEEGDLERLFFGRPKQKVGNYARQEAKENLDIVIKARFNKHLKDGLPRKDAAERVVNELGLTVDADSILRKLRGFNGFMQTTQPKG